MAEVKNYVDYLGDEEEVEKKPKKKKLSKAEKAELKRLKEVEFHKLEMRDQLRRELIYSKKTVAKARQSWLDMMREIKLARMREELEAWEAKTNRVFKQKDEQIESILDDMATTEEMHRRSYCAQIDAVDYLKDLFKAFRENLRYRYEVESKEILHDFYNKTCELSEIQTAYENKFLAKLDHTNISLEQDLRKEFEETIEKRNDNVNEEILKRYNMRDATSKKMNRLRSQLLEFLGALLGASLDPLKYDKVKYLMQRQKNFVNEAQKLTEVENKNTYILRELQEELAQVESDEKKKISDLKLELNYFLDVHKTIDKKMKVDRENTHQKLRVLTTECYGMCKSLEKLRKYGELLLSLSANCRKLQTESEKVTLSADFREPQDLPDCPSDDEFQVEVLDLKSHIDLNDDELQAHMKLMKNFWRRQALAEAQTVLLAHKKEELLQENQYYIDKIKALSKADDVAELQSTLSIKCVLEEEIPCSNFKKLCY